MRRCVWGAGLIARAKRRTDYKGEDIFMMRKESNYSIRQKAVRDARIDGILGKPVRQHSWTDEAWMIYEEAYKEEISEIGRGWT